MYQHSWMEILLYSIPFITVFLTKKYLKPHLRQFQRWPLPIGLLLIPLWLTLIYCFGYLLYDLNVIPFILFISCFSLGLQLYNYVRRIEHFSFNRYYLVASKLLFTQLSIFLLGLMILRLIVFFWK